jgi:hypothetical protein
MKLYEFAASYAMKRPVSLKIRLNKTYPTSVEELSEFCIKFNILEMYIWLSHHFPKYFIERERCMEQKEYALKVIESTLQSSIESSSSHISAFNKRSMRLDKCEEGLPSSISDSIRRDMKSFLSNTPEHKWVVLNDESVII